MREVDVDTRQLYCLRRTSHEDSEKCDDIGNFRRRQMTCIMLMTDKCHVRILNMKFILNFTILH